MFKNMLAAEGVPCVVKNDNLSAAIGEIPFTECCPELWVIDDEVYPRARLLLDAWLSGEGADSADWVCPGCGEQVAAQFSVCWNCFRQHD